MANQKIALPAASPAFGLWLREQPAGAKRAYSEVKRLLNNEKTHDLRWWHRLGQCLATLYPPGSPRRYGNRFMAILASGLPGGATKRRVNMLYRARSFAAETGAEDLSELLKAMQVKGSPLRLRHVFNLQTLDRSKRQGLLQRCTREGWTAERLLREIQDRRGYRSSGGGRPARSPPPQPLPVALRDVAILCRRWIAHAETWLDERSGSLLKGPTGVQKEAAGRELRQIKQLLPDVRRKAASVQRIVDRLARQIAE